VLLLLSEHRASLGETWEGVLARRCGRQCWRRPG
jgi:hypothetical protein